MLAYLVRRLLWLPVLLIIVSFITFALGYYWPADPIAALMGQNYDPEIAAQLAREYGFDQPFSVQYLKYLERVARLDFGESIKYRNQPVLRLLIPRLAVTIQLNVASSLIGVSMGTTLGVIAALKRGQLIDRLVVFGVVIGRAIPVFVAGPILLFLFARTIPVLPPGGWDGIFSRSAVLPVVLLSIGPIAVFARQTRAGMLEVMGQDYIRTARAKGLSERQVLYGHVFRNAMLIVIAGFPGAFISAFFAGSLLIEQIFSLDGLGLLGFKAAIDRDYAVVFATLYIFSLMGLLTNLITDVVYTLIDPRIDFEKREL